MKTLPTIVPNKSASDFFNNSISMMANLATRWANESQYENPNDYKNVIQSHADKYGVKITKMIRRPFGCEFTVDNRTYRYTVKMNGKIELEYIA